VITKIKHHSMSKMKLGVINMFIYVELTLAFFNESKQTYVALTFCIGATKNALLYIRRFEIYIYNLCRIAKQII